MLYVTCKIKEKIVSFLVDTGSRLTIVPLDFAVEILPSSLRLIAANGSQIRNFGYSTIRFSIRKLRREFTWRVVVADVVNPILDADFLAHHGILVDLKHRRLTDSLTNCCSPCTVSNESHDQFPILAICDDCPDYVTHLLQQFPSISQPFSGYEPVFHDTKHYIETDGPPVAC